MIILVYKILYYIYNIYIYVLCIYIYVIITVKTTKTMNDSLTLNYVLT